VEVAEAVDLDGEGVAVADVGHGGGVRTSGSRRTVRRRRWSGVSGSGCGRAEAAAVVGDDGDRCRHLAQDVLAGSTMSISPQSSRKSSRPVTRSASAIAACRQSEVHGGGNRLATTGGFGQRACQPLNPRASMPFGPVGAQRTVRRETSPSPRWTVHVGDMA